MARSHGKVLAKAWQDEDWTALAPKHQWLYMLLLSQPKLTLIGCLDYMPHRWARLAAGVTVEYIEAIVADLEACDKVVVDRATDELLIRTFVRHDGIEKGNVNLRKGMWGAWRAMQSATLRKVAVDNLPDSLWTDTEDEEAEQMRRSEPMERASERALRQALERASEPSLIPNPSYSSLHTPSVARPDDRSVDLDQIDLEHHEPARIPDEIREQNLAAVAALKANPFQKRATA